MGGIGDFLFGEEPEMKMESAPRMTQEQMTLLNKLSSLLTGQLGKGTGTYGEDIVAGLTGLEKTALGKAEGLGVEGMDFLSGILGRGPEAEEDYWRKAFVAPAQRLFEKELAPSILEKFAGLDALDSGASRRALVEGATDLTTNLGSQLANIVYKSQWDKAQIPGMGMDLVAKMLGAGEVERGVQTAQGQEGYQKWQQAQPWANPWLQYLGIPMSVQPMENMMYQTGGSSGLLGSMMPMLGTALGGPIGGMLSGGISNLFSGGGSSPYSVANPGWYSGWTIG